MFLESLFPNLPTSISEIFIYVSVTIGVILVIYSQFVEAEFRRDLIRAIGAGGVLIYSLYVYNIFFIILSIGIGAAALIEFVEIYLGYHNHTPHEIKEYIKKYKRKQ